MRMRPPLGSGRIRSKLVVQLPLLGSNQDSPDPESGVLPVTPRGIARIVVRFQAESDQFTSPGSHAQVRRGDIPGAGRGRTRWHDRRSPVSTEPLHSSPATHPSRNASIG